MYGHPRDLTVLTHSFPTRRSSDLVDDTLHDAVEMGPLLAEFLLDALALAQRGRKLPQERVGLADQEADLRAPVAAGNPNQRRRRRTRVYFAQIVRYAQNRPRQDELVGNRQDQAQDQSLNEPEEQQGSGPIQHA